MSQPDRKGRKLRVGFKPNRQAPRRAGDLTRRFRTDQEKLADERQVESVRAKGELSRKRTIFVDQDGVPVVDESQWRRGTVLSVHGLVSRVEAEDATIWDCTARRVLRTLLIEQRSVVTCGDRVWFSDHAAYHDGQPVGVIERVEPRTTVLSRRERRGHDRTRRLSEHAIVANADQLLIVTSIAEPRCKPHLIDRYLVAAGKGHLRPVIVFNKWDLLGEEVRSQKSEVRSLNAGALSSEAGGSGETDPQLGTPKSELDVSANRASDAELAVDFEDEDYAGPAITVADLVGEYRRIGYTCLLTSAISGLGLDELRDVLRGRMTVLGGQSGVGKSSLLNALQPGLGLEVREVSPETEKGRHTTSLARLLKLDIGGWVVDTPGIRQFDLWNVEPGELEAYFTEFVPLVPQCRFRDCHHVQEESCAVIAAVERGQISYRRYCSYLKMLDELSEERRRSV